MSLRIVPVSFRHACGFVKMWHRYLPPPPGCKFCIGVADDANRLVGVAIVGRPVARHLDDGMTLEVTRTATDGTANANSKLYGKAWEAARAQGYRRLITYNHTRVYGPTCAEPCAHQSCHYIRVGESGASHRGAGWQVLHHRPARPGWDTPSRPRQATGAEGIPRTLWETS
ncbi:XF1762 family protein [Streptosporangium roseum]|uniref:XF1762 family protein n=1 Tax=Streptosporangium roseum TaxID=2001 RepID=UPI00332665AC